MRSDDPLKVEKDVVSNTYVTIYLAKAGMTSCRKVYAATSELAALAHRIDAIQSSLVNSGALVRADLEQNLKSSRDTHTSDQTDTGHPSSRRPSQAEEEVVDNTEGAALTLEHLAFGRSHVAGGHSLPHFGARLQSTIGKHVPNNDYHLASQIVTYPPGLAPEGSRRRLSDGVVADGSGESSALADASAEERTRRIDELLELIGPYDAFDLLYRKTDVALRALTRVLPTTETGELLVNSVGSLLGDI